MAQHHNIPMQQQQQQLPSDIMALQMFHQNALQTSHGHTSSQVVPPNTSLSDKALQAISENLRDNKYDSHYITYIFTHFSIFHITAQGFTQYAVLHI